MARDKTTTFSIKLTGDAAGAVGAIKAVSAQLAMMEGDFKDVADKLNAESKRIEAGISKAAAAAAAKAPAPAAPERSRLQTGVTDRITDLADSVGLGEFSDDITGAVDKLGGLGAAMAAVTVVAAGLAKALFEIGQFSLGKLTEIAPQVDQLANTMRISTEEATKFWYAISAKGVDTTQAIDALVQMQTNLNASPEKFKALGIEQARFADGSADLEGTLMNVAAAWREGDAAQRASIGSIALGEEAYRELQPLLALTNEEFDALKGKAGNVLSAEDTAKAAQYKQAMAEVTQQLGLLGAKLGAELAPYVVVVAEALNHLAANASKVADILGPAVTVGAAVLKTALESIPGAGNVAGRAAVYVGEQWVEGAQKVQQSASLIGAARAALNAGIANFAGALVPEAEQKRVAGLRNDLVGTYQDIADAKMTVSEAAASYAVAEAEASVSVAAANANAEASIASAARGMESAHKGQADAAAGLAQAEAQAAQSMADAARSAEKSINAAQKRLVDAQEKRVEADEDLAKVERDTNRDLAKQAEDSAERIIDAQRAVTDAREDARRAERDGARDLADARSAYQDALQADLTGDETNPFKRQRDREKALLELQRTETDVAESTQDAAKNVADAEEQLRDAHVEAAENRAEAEERATEQIEAARERQAESIEALQEAEVGLSETIQEAERSKASAAASAASSISAARQRVVDADAAAYQAAEAYGKAIEDADRDKAKAAEDAASRVEAARQREADAEKKLLLDQLAAARIRRQLADPNFVDRMSMSESNFIAESDTIPRFHGGGVYHAPTPGGEGLAILRDGETVLTPGQSVGGSSVTVIVQGSVISERELIEIIAKAARRGNGG